MAEALRIAVFGGSGKIGREAIRSLQAAGHQCSNFDVRPSPDPVRTALVDAADFGQCIGALSGVDLVGAGFDAVLHLAGLAAPGLAADHEVFRVNTLSTYNVLSACRRLGIKRVVWASSETLHGQPFTQTPPDFLPIDENPPRRAGWSYALAKGLGEEMAAEFARWSPEASITSLRFSNVFGPGEYGAFADIQARPEPRRLNLWSYVDVRDCGEACRLALEAALPGHEVLIIAGPDSMLDVPSRELARTYFPGVPVRSDPGGCWAFLSSDKATRLIGYRPRWSWRNAVG